MKSTATALIALALTLPSHSTQAEPGRLFFTPEKRAALDHARRHQLNENQVEKPAAITVNGVIQGPGGATVWVNGQAVKNESVAAGIKVRVGEDPGVAALTPLAKGGQTRHRLKVGETLITPVEK